ncbi:MAG: hypothetical protein ACI9R3_000612 [Verrucomicrobiales bacterium]|jgi:hypothetical protein
MNCIGFIGSSSGKEALLEVILSSQSVFVRSDMSMLLKVSHLNKK